MPDQEPSVLLEMEEKFSTMLGLTHHTKKREGSNLTIDQMQANMMNPKLIEQDFRFFI